jgi:anti-sigma regulatory factor (Ser/Thr protein kinase)
MDRVNGLLAFLAPATMTTGAYLELDPEKETLVVVCAGHPPPLVIAPDGEARYLDVPSGVALGVSRGSRFEQVECPLPAGSTIVLYTDGVIEVRGESLDVGLERMRQLAGRGHESIEELCDSVIEELVADGRPADDVALLAARPIPLADRLVTDWPAHADALAGLRHLLRRWLLHHGANANETYDITVACQEAAANAVEHAYAPGARTFDVEAVRVGAAIEVTVRDHGGWRSPRGTNRGRGLVLMEALMDSTDVEHTDAGTVVRLRRVLAAGDAA